MAVGPIGVTSFKGLWEIKTVPNKSSQTNNLQREFIYHNFKDEYISPSFLQHCGNKIDGKYACDEYDDLDHVYPHTIENKCKAGSRLNMTSSTYDDMDKRLLNPKFFETSALASKIVPKKTDFGYSQFESDYGEVNKL